MFKSVIRNDYILNALQLQLPGRFIKLVTGQHLKVSSLKTIQKLRCKLNFHSLYNDKNLVLVFFGCFSFTYKETLSPEIG